MGLATVPAPSVMGLPAVPRTLAGAVVRVDLAIALEMTVGSAGVRGATRLSGATFASTGRDGAATVDPVVCGGAAAGADCWGMVAVSAGARIWARAMGAVMQASGAAMATIAAARASVGRQDVLAAGSVEDRDTTSSRCCAHVLSESSRIAPLRPERSHMSDLIRRSRPPTAAVAPT